MVWSLPPLPVWKQQHEAETFDCSLRKQSEPTLSQTKKLGCVKSSGESLQQLPRKQLPAANSARWSCPGASPGAACPSAGAGRGTVQRGRPVSNAFYSVGRGKLGWWVQTQPAMKWRSCMEGWVWSSLFLKASAAWVLYRKQKNNFLKLEGLSFYRIDFTASTWIRGSSIRSHRSPV